MIERLRSQRGVVVGRVEHDLAAALLGGVGGEAVFEDGDVVVGLGHLRLYAPRPGRAERALGGARVIGAVLAPGRDRHPLLQEWVPAKLAQTRS